MDQRREAPACTRGAVDPGDTARRVVRRALAAAGATTAVLAMSLAMSASAQAQRGCAPGQSAGCPIRALALDHRATPGEVASPALTALKRRLGERIRLRRADRVPRERRHPRRFELLIVDGDDVSGARMGRKKLIDRFVARGRWVLALDLRGAHHDRAIEPRSGFGLPSGHRSRVFLFRQQAVDGTPAIEMLDAERLQSRGAQGLGKRARRAAKRKEIRRVARLVARHVTRERPGSGVTAGASLPAQAQLVRWSFKQTGSQKLDDGFYTRGRRLCQAFVTATEPIESCARNRQLDEERPTPRDQIASWTMNHQFAAYLDNEARPQGNFQYVAYDLTGSFTPAQDGKFFHMGDHWRVGLTTQQLERAWWTGMIEPSIKPLAEEKLSLVANAPSAGNEVTRYTSGQDFEVGIHATSEEGVGVDATYKVSTESEREIPDWGVESEASGPRNNHLSWRFSSRECDPRWDTEGGSGWLGCFAMDVLDPGTPRDPNELSTSQITGRNFHVAALWKTQRNGDDAVLDNAGGQLAFDVGVPVRMIDTFCGGWGVFACWADLHHIERQRTGPRAGRYTINVGDVLPREIEAIELDPDPANGARGEDVKGAVVLAEPVPFETTLMVFSDKNQAVVGPPVAGSPEVSSTEVRIPAGKSRGTFTVKTNDNGPIQSGEHVTASISVWYAGEATTERLCVVGQPDDSCTGG